MRNTSRILEAPFGWTPCLHQRSSRSFIGQFPLFYTKRVPIALHSFALSILHLIPGLQDLCSLLFLRVLWPHCQTFSYWIVEFTFHWKSFDVCLLWCPWFWIFEYSLTVLRCSCYAVVLQLQNWALGDLVLIAASGVGLLDFYLLLWFPRRPRCLLLCHGVIFRFQKLCSPDLPAITSLELEMNVHSIWSLKDGSDPQTRQRFFLSSLEDLQKRLASSLTLHFKLI